MTQHERNLGFVEYCQERRRGWGVGVCSGTIPSSKLCGGIQGRAVINWHWQSNGIGQLLVIQGCLFKSKATQVLFFLSLGAFPSVLLLFINISTRKAENECPALWSSSGNELAWRMLNHWDLKMIHASQAWIGRKITYMEIQLTSFHLVQLMTSDILEDKISGSPFSDSFPDSQSVDVSFFLDPMRTLRIPSSYFNYSSAHFHIEDIPTLCWAQISYLMQTSRLSTKHMGQDPNR